MVLASKGPGSEGPGFADTLLGWTPRYLATTSDRLGIWASGNREIEQVERLLMSNKPAGQINDKAPYGGSLSRSLMVSTDLRAPVALYPYLVNSLGTMYSGEK